MHCFYKILIFSIGSSVMAFNVFGTGEDGEQAVPPKAQQTRPPDKFVDNYLDNLGEKMEEGIPKLDGAGNVVLTPDEIQRITDAMKESMLSDEPPTDGQNIMPPPELNKSRVVEINTGKFIETLSSRVSGIIENGEKALDFFNRIKSSEGFNPNKITYDHYFDICFAFTTLHDSVQTLAEEMRAINNAVNVTGQDNYQLLSFFDYDFVFNYFLFMNVQSNVGSTYCSYSAYSIMFENWILSGIPPTNLDRFIKSQKSLVSRAGDLMLEINHLASSGNLQESLFTSLDPETLALIKDYITITPGDE